MRVGAHCYISPTRGVDAPLVQTLKVRLDGALSSLI